MMVLNRMLLLGFCVWGSWVEPQGTETAPITFTVHTSRTDAGQWQAEVDVSFGQSLQDLVVMHRTEPCGVGEDKHTVISKTTVTAGKGLGRPTLHSTCDTKPVTTTLCPNPWSPSMQFSCGSSEQAAPCNAQVPVGTKASMSCKPGYIARRPGPKGTTCLETGNWRGPLLDCIKLAPGYEFFPRLGWYQLYMIGNTFQQAKRVCEFDGGSLGVIDSPGEFEVMTALINQSRLAVNIEHQHDIYVGVNREDGQEYVDFSGRPMSANYNFKWCPGRPPIKNTNGDCTIFAKQLSCHWDSACNRKLAFLCEIPLDGKEQ